MHSKQGKQGFLNPSKYKTVTNVTEPLRRLISSNLKEDIVELLTKYLRLGFGGYESAIATGYCMR